MGRYDDTSASTKASSDMDTSDDEHPLDKLMAERRLKVGSREQLETTSSQREVEHEPTTSTPFAVNDNGILKSESSSEEGQLPHISPTTSGRDVVSLRYKEDLRPGTSKSQEVKPPLLGVTVIEEGKEDARNVNVQRMLRQQRYFQDDFEMAAGPRCYVCGKSGHFARDCQNEPKERACYLCAQYGHERSNCPNMLCFKCGQLGHVSRDCRNASRSLESSRCLRCGHRDCASSGENDAHRADGGCSKDYDPHDLSLALCYQCGKFGHLSCTPAPMAPPPTSCYNCGEAGHLGPECWKDTTAVVRAERYNSGRINRHDSQSSLGWQGSYRGGDKGGYGSIARTMHASRAEPQAREGFRSPPNRKRTRDF